MCNLFSPHNYEFVKEADLSELELNEIKASHRKVRFLDSDIIAFNTPYVKRCSKCNKLIITETTTDFGH